MMNRKADKELKWTSNTYRRPLPQCRHHRKCVRTCLISSLTSFHYSFQKMLTLVRVPSPWRLFWPWASCPSCAWPVVVGSVCDREGSAAVCRIQKANQGPQSQTVRRTGFSVRTHYRLVSQTNENLTWPVRHSVCARGKRTREGAKSGIGRLQRMKHGSGMKDRDDKSNGIEILMTDSFVKIKPSDPFRFAKQAARRQGWWFYYSRWSEM